jgi:hypothetical protein
MDRIKRILIQYLVKDLLCAVPEDDLLLITTTGWLKNKRKLSGEEVAFLKEEAKIIKESLLWKVMNDELRYQANLRMFEKGQIPENTTFGRAMLYNQELMREYVERISSL